jgi:branched-chain amino acid transport system permease protein
MAGAVMQLFIELLTAGMMAGMKLGIPALGFALIFYTTRELHFAFGAITVLAAYILLWTLKLLGAGALGVSLGVAGSITLTVLLSVAVHKWIYLKLNSVLPVVMASLGLALIIENAIQIVAGPDPQLVSFAAFVGIVEIGFVRVRMIDVYVLFAFILLAVAMELFLNRTRVGQGLGATMDDPEMAELVGIRTAVMRIGAYVAGSSLGALTGMVMLVDTGAKPSNGFIILLFAVIITIMGRGNLRSVIVWSALFGIVRGLWSWKFSTEYQELAMFVFMLAYLIGRDGWERRQANRVMGRPANVTLEASA